MNKADLAAHLAEVSGITKSDASKAVDSLLSGIVSALEKGEEVKLAGFGAFAVSKRPAKTGRNPRTGETMEIAASTAVKFKPAKALKDSVNG